ncbi:MAG: hypothetical protein KIT35_02395 [Piscinibacter sp.]|uniref:hypothetical protein n=1 Tax=Piscinibacter sp. TaxID=1903157 RepID=UPI00259113C1|nr:hypothetical protein [Piscinibacter sp.]MCW5662660.1 hypothetical protein [Piscinibacter sp.]
MDISNMGLSFSEWGEKGFRARAVASRFPAWLGRLRLKPSRATAGAWPAPLFQLQCVAAPRSGSESV